MPQDLENSALSRRDFVGKVATGAAGAAVALTATVAQASPGRKGAEHQISAKTATTEEEVSVFHGEEEGYEQASEAAAQPWGLLQPLREGSEIADGWHLAALTGVVHGSCVVTLRNESGREYRVHVCRNNGNPQGLVYTNRFDLVVMNGGRGDLPTEESVGQAVAKLAHIMAANESSQAEVVASLMTQADRVDSYTTSARLR